MITLYEFVSEHRRALKTMIRNTTLDKTELLSGLYKTLAFIETRAREKRVFGDGMFGCICGNFWSATDYDSPEYDSGEVCPGCNRKTDEENN